MFSQIKKAGGLDYKLQDLEFLWCSESHPSAQASRMTWRYWTMIHFAFGEINLSIETDIAAAQEDLIRKLDDIIGSPNAGAAARFAVTAEALVYEQMLPRSTLPAIREKAPAFQETINDIKAKANDTFGAVEMKTLTETVAQQFNAPRAA